VAGLKAPYGIIVQGSRGLLAVGGVLNKTYAGRGAPAASGAHLRAVNVYDSRRTFGSAALVMSRSDPLSVVSSTRK
jgi:hypothetical protein